MTEIKKDLTIEEKLKWKIPYQWKIQSFNKAKTKASCVAYIDARDVMDLLDRAVGFNNWQDKYYECRGQIMCSLGIRLGENQEFVWRSDTGSAGDIEAEKSIVSDAFKRAAVKWGIGRFLYDLRIQWVDIAEINGYRKPVDPNGKEITNLTAYFTPVKR